MGIRCDVLHFNKGEMRVYYFNLFHCILRARPFRVLADPGWNAARFFTPGFSK
jgi:hypothetical protein